MKITRYIMIAVAVLGLLNTSNLLFSRGGGGGGGHAGGGGHGFGGGGRGGGFGGGGGRGFSGGCYRGGGGYARGGGAAGAHTASVARSSRTMHSARSVGASHAATGHAAGAHGAHGAHNGHFNNNHGWHNNWGGWGGWGWFGGLWWGLPWWGWFGLGFYPWFWLWSSADAYGDDAGYYDDYRQVGDGGEYDAGYEQPAKNQNVWSVTNQTGAEVTFGVNGKEYVAPAGQTVSVNHGNTKRFSVETADNASGTFEADDTDLYIFERDGNIQVETE